MVFHGETIYTWAHGRLSVATKKCARESSPSLVKQHSNPSNPQWVDVHSQARTAPWQVVRGSAGSFSLNAGQADEASNNQKDSSRSFAGSSGLIRRQRIFVIMSD